MNKQFKKAEFGRLRVVNDDPKKVVLIANWDFDGNESLVIDVCQLRELFEKKVSELQSLKIKLK